MNIKGTNINYYIISRKQKFKVLIWILGSNEQDFFLSKKGLINFDLFLSITSVTVLVSSWNDTEFMRVQCSWKYTTKFMYLLFILAVHSLYIRIFKSGDNLIVTVILLMKSSHPGSMVNLKCFSSCTIVIFISTSAKCLPIQAWGP